MMEKLKKNTKWLLIIFLILTILLIMGMNDIFSSTLFIIVGILYCIDVIGLIINICIYVKEEKKYMNKMFDLYFNLYKIIYDALKKYNENKGIDFISLCEEINDKVAIIREELKKDKSLILDKMNKNNNILGLEHFNFTEDKVDKLLKNDNEEMNKFFNKMLTILRKILVVINERKLKEKEMELKES